MLGMYSYAPLGMYSYAPPTLDELANEAKVAGVPLKVVDDPGNEQVHVELHLSSGVVRSSYSRMSDWQKGCAYENALMTLRAYVSSRPRRIGGVSNAPRVPCAKSTKHGHHASDERCPYCE